MSNKILNTRIQIRNDSAEAWKSSNPILFKGEIGIESDTRKFKIGDATSTWTSLPYVTYSLDELNTRFTSINEDIDNAFSTFDEYVPLTQKGIANGVAPLGEDGLIASSYLPSYVDDVLEYASLTSFPSTGESGKIYIAIDTGKTYRWGGTTYAEISSSLALGTTEGTAFSGLSGAMLQTEVGQLSTSLSSHSTNINNPHSVTKAQVGLGNVTNESKATMFTNPTFTGTVSLPTSTKIGNLSTTGLVKYTNGTLSVDTNTYSTTTNTISSLSISGSIMTVTKANGTSSTITLPTTPKATTSTLGTVMPTYSTSESISCVAQSTIENRFYGVSITSDGKLFVNIPWTDTVYTHPTTAGHKHIPSGGASGQILRWSSSGTAVWGADNNNTYTAGTGLSLNGTTFSVSDIVVTTDDTLILDGGNSFSTYE